MLADPSGKFEMIPVDCAIAAIIVIAKDQAEKPEK